MHIKGLNILFIVLLLICVAGCGVNKSNTGKIISPEAKTLAAASESKQEIDVEPVANTGGDMNQQSSLDISAILARQEAAMKTVNTCRSNTYLNIDMKAGAAGIGDLFIKADMKSLIDTRQRILSSHISTTLVAAKNKKHREQQIVASGSQVYMKADQSSGGQWQVKTLDATAEEKLWQEQQAQLTGLKYSELLAPVNFVYAGKENSNGHSCLKFRQSLDFDRIMEASPDLKGQLQNMEGLLSGKLEKVIEQADITVFIDEESSYLREFNLEARVNTEFQGQKVSGTIKQYCRYDRFNKKVSIDIPALENR
ncbi:MAG: hypothetical protein ABFD08_09445 [Syntrophomonas sp.]